MLILTRRVGESLIIGDDVTITVLGVKGNQVRSVSMLLAMSPCIEKRSSIDPDSNRPGKDTPSMDEQADEQSDQK